MELIGCDLNQFKNFIERQFKEGMNWENRDKWHLDHIVPIKYFEKNYDMKDFEIQKICFHYLNFQPLWAKDNLSKGSYYEGRRHCY